MICARPGCGVVFCDDRADIPPGVPATSRRYCTPGCRRADQPKRQIQLAGRLAEAVCQARLKDPYPSREDALADVPVKSRQYGKPVQPYECPDCGQWHLTSRPLDADGQPAWTLDTLARRWNERVLGAGGDADGRGWSAGLPAVRVFCGEAGRTCRQG